MKEKEWKEQDNEGEEKQLEL
jgi:hypothetical protein